MIRSVKLKLRYCLKCGETMDEMVCPEHHTRTYPNSWIRRFPRYSKRTLAVMKAARKGSRDARGW